MLNYATGIFYLFIFFSSHSHWHDMHVAGGGKVKGTLLHTIIQVVRLLEVLHVVATPDRAQGSKFAPKWGKITQGVLDRARYPLA